MFKAILRRIQSGSRARQLGLLVVTDGTIQSIRFRITLASCLVVQIQRNKIVQMPTGEYYNLLGTWQDADESEADEVIQFLMHQPIYKEPTCL